MPQIGETVLYKFGSAQQPTVRPAIIVRVWNETGVNLAVLPDGSNDGAAVEWKQDQTNLPAGKGYCGFWWITSVCRGDDLGQWSYPT